MPPARRAVIDIGTNSVKLLVAEVAGRDAHPLLEDSSQTRLGRNFYETRRLQPDAIEKTAAAVARFAGEARRLGAQSVRVIATSAARDATNPRDLVDAIARTAGLPVEIISGEQEADWVFRGVTSDPGLASTPLLLLDAGGGSTEFILGQGDRVDFRHSFPLGAVRLHEQFPPADPPGPAGLAACRAWVENFLKREVRQKISAALRQEMNTHPLHRRAQLVGTGGSATILARMEAKTDGFDRAQLEATRLSFARVQWHLENLWSRPLAERKTITGLPPNRADIALPGVLIYAAVMAEFGFAELRVSTRGLRFAALMTES
jgi:exopolyphosphatase / guanosine-5'-triphosphate,3'-diphosphate pyrophosphatase